MYGCLIVVAVTCVLYMCVSRVCVCRVCGVSVFSLCFMVFLWCVVMVVVARAFCLYMISRASCMCAGACVCGCCVVAYCCCVCAFCYVQCISCCLQYFICVYVFRLFGNM